MPKIKTIIIFLTIFFGVLLLPKISWAANHYIRQGASGANNGTDWTNAWTTLPNTLTRGDTYYIADGTYGAYTFDDAESTSTYIYIKKATASDHGTDTGWNSTYGDGEAVFQVSSGIVWQFGTGYWDIDGQIGSGKDPGNYGFRVYSTSSRCPSYLSDRLVHFNGNDISYLTIKHVEFDWNNGTSSCTTAVTKALNTYSSTSDHITLQYCYFHHSTGFVFYIGSISLPLQQYWTIEYCYFYSNGGGGGTSAHMETFWFTNTDNSIFRYNVIEDSYGGTDAQTGWLMLGACDNFKIYGNLFFCSSNCGTGNNGTIGTWSADQYVCTDVYIYHNSFVDISGGASPKIYFYHNSANDLNVVCKNNLYYNASFSWTGVDTQSHEACGGGQNCAGINQQTGILTTQFINYVGDNFHLASSTIAGDNTIGVEYNTDMDSVTRGVDGTWDRGAYEYIETTPPDTTPPAAPSGVTVQ